jgi:hypothetical protein
MDIKGVFATFYFHRLSPSALDQTIKLHQGSVPRFADLQP